MQFFVYKFNNFIHIHLLDKEASAYTKASLSLFVILYYFIWDKIASAAASSSPLPDKYSWALI